MRALWSIPSYGTTISVAGNSRDAITAVALGSTRVVDKATYVLGMGYEARKNALTCKARYSLDNLSGEMSYDSISGEVVLKGTQKYNSRNSFSPAIALKSKRVAYEWLRKWPGGFLNAALRPSDRELQVDWKDRSVTGDWTTKMIFPLDNVAASKVSFSHDWEC